LTAAANLNCMHRYSRFLFIHAVSTHFQSLPESGSAADLFQQLVQLLLQPLARLLPARRAVALPGWRLVAGWRELGWS